MAQKVGRREKKKTKRLGRREKLAQKVGRREKKKSKRLGRREKFAQKVGRREIHPPIPPPPAMASKRKASSGMKGLENSQVHLTAVLDLSTKDMAVSPVPERMMGKRINPR